MIKNAGLYSPAFYVTLTSYVTLTFYKTLTFYIMLTNYLFNSVNHLPHSERSSIFQPVVLLELGAIIAEVSSLLKRFQML